MPLIRGRPIARAAMVGGAGYAVGKSRARPTRSASASPPPATPAPCTRSPSTGTPWPQPGGDGTVVLSTVVSPRAAPAGPQSNWPARLGHGLNENEWATHIEGLDYRTTCR